MPPESKSEKKTTGKPDPEESETYNPLSLSDFSDTARTFPTLGQQSPLIFLKREGRERDQTRIKQEQEEEDIERTTNIEPLTGEADDEDEEGDDDADFPANWRDSGLGTSFDEGERRRAVQRRRRALFGGGRGADE